MKRDGIVTRRWFIGGAACALAGCRYGGLVGDFGSAKPLARLGVLSDVHLNEPGDEGHLVKALAYFRDHGADGVLIAGDIADTGRVDQLERFASTWFKVFPDDRAPDGRRVERLFVYGNHDILGWTWNRDEGVYTDDAAKRRLALGFEDVRAKTWERLFHEPYEEVWRKTVNGIDVVGAHWTDANDFGHAADWFAKHAKEIDPSRPLVYTQHAHPKDTCYGPAAWGHDAGESTRALSEFPNAIAFSGHSHYTLVDERSVWQGAFTSIGTATLRRTSLDYLEPENSNGNPFDPRAKDWTRRKIMRPLYRDNGKEGMIVDVCADRLVIRRRDFVFDRSLGDDWTVPLPAACDSPFAYAARAKKRAAPAFASDAKVVVRVTDERPSCARTDTEGPYVLVTFPAAKTVAKCRAFKYHVRALDADGNDELAARQIMAPGFNLPEEECALPAECLFLASDFPPAAEVRFEVRASECFGRMGDAIVSGIVTMTTSEEAEQLTCRR